MKPKLTRILSWRLRVMMAERNITTVTELHRRLLDSGYEITSSQLSRIVKDRPDRISTDLLDHLLEILECDIGDLLRSDPVPTDYSSDDENSDRETSAAKPQKQRVRREPVAYNPDDNLTGPKVTPFPIPPRKK